MLQLQCQNHMFNLFSLNLFTFISNVYVVRHRYMVSKSTLKSTSQILNSTQTQEGGKLKQC